MQQTLAKTFKFLEPSIAPLTKKFYVKKDQDVSYKLKGLNFYCILSS